MNKKIKALVQKYEKDMQFENRFEDLKDKLDLIPDQNNTNEVYVIRKKLMPAYMMTIVLLMLVTGIIGLQLGLNSNYITGPDETDPVEQMLSQHADIFERESVESIYVNDKVRLLVYIGIKNNQKIILVHGFSTERNNVINLSIGGVTQQVSQGMNFLVFSISNDQEIELHAQILMNNVMINEVNYSLDLSLDFDYLGF